MKKSLIIIAGVLLVITSVSAMQGSDLDKSLLAVIGSACAVNYLFAYWGRK